MENESDLATAAKPWRWKLWIKRFLLSLLVVAIVFVWLMRRPLGEPVPGVRLEPLVTQSPKESTAGSFGARIEEIRSRAQNLALYEEPLHELVQLNEKPWNDATNPFLTKTFVHHAPTFKLLEDAANTPDSGERILAHFNPQDPLAHLLIFYLAQIHRDLQQNELQFALGRLLTIKKLSKRIVRVGFILGQRPFLEMSLPYIAATFEKLNTEDHLSALDDILEGLEMTSVSPAELTRYALQDDKEQALAGNYDMPLGRNPLWGWCIGSDPKNMQGNLDTLFSEIIHQQEIDPETSDFEPVLQKYVGKSGSLKRDYGLGPDPVSCWFARQAVGHINYIQTNDTFDVARTRCIRTAIAARRFTLKHQRTPQTLAEFMPEPLLDPFTNRPLLFKLNADQQWIIYSTGENKIDDGGIYDPSASRNSKDKRSSNSKDIGIWSNETERLQQSRSKPKSAKP